MPKVPDEKIFSLAESTQISQHNRGPKTKVAQSHLKYISVPKSLISVTTLAFVNTTHAHLHKNAVLTR